MQAAIFVVDLTDKVRVSTARTEFFALLDHAESRKYLKGVLLFLNKADVEGDTMTSSEVETIFNLEQQRREFHHVSFRVQMCSGLKGTGIEEGFRWLADVVVVGNSGG